MGSLRKMLKDRDTQARDDYDLDRFVAAQAPIYDEALTSLRGGEMCAPYMDIIFPRLPDAIDSSAIDPFALRSLDEARAYLAFPVLGSRYRECVDALSWLANLTPAQVFGAADTRKLHASLTLFAEASDEHLLRFALAIWFDERLDQATIAHLDLTSCASDQAQTLRL